MQASEITKPGAYWFLDDDQYLVPGWRIIEVRRRDGRLVVLWPGAYSDRSVDDIDSGGQVVGPIEPPATVTAAPTPDPRLNPAPGDVLRIGASLITVTGVGHNLMAYSDAVTFHCEPSLLIGGQLRDQGTVSLFSWRIATEDMIVERLGPRFSS